MRYFKKWWSVLGLSIAVALPALAQDENDVMHTDWLELVKGYRGDKVGAEVTEVEESDGEGSRTLVLTIPKASIVHPDSIEEVMVIGKKPGKSAPLLDMSYEWVDDYDNDNYGLVIRLSKDSKWPIRLYMYSDSGFIR